MQHKSKTYQTDMEHLRAAFVGAFELGQPWDVIGLQMLLWRMQTLNWDTANITEEEDNFLLKAGYFFEQRSSAITGQTFHLQLVQRRLTSLRNYIFNRERKWDVKMSAPHLSTLSPHWGQETDYVIISSYSSKHHWRAPTEMPDGSLLIMREVSVMEATYLRVR